MRRPRPRVRQLEAEDHVGPADELARGRCGSANGATGNSSARLIDDRRLQISASSTSRISPGSRPREPAGDDHRGFGRDQHLAVSATAPNRLRRRGHRELRNPQGRLGRNRVFLQPAVGDVSTGIIGGVIAIGARTADSAKCWSEIGDRPT